MRHLKRAKKLRRPFDHRKALKKMLCCELIKHGRIKTTVAKAKFLRTVIEPLITKAKKGGLHNIRLVSRLITDKKLVKKLFTEIAPLYIDRKGGYTRILKIDNRAGDNAPMALIEFVDWEKIYKKEEEKKEEKEKTKDKTQKQEKVADTKSSKDKSTKK